MTEMRRLQHGRHRSAVDRAVLWIVVLVILSMQAGCTVGLLNASASGNLDSALGLLQQGEDVNGRFPIVGTSPVMLAAGHGHMEVLRALIDAGADVNAVDFTGWTALHAAAYKGDKAIVSLLLEHGTLSADDHWFLPSPAGIAETLGHKDIVPLLRPPGTQPDSSVP